MYFHKVDLRRCTSKSTTPNGSKKAPREELEDICAPLGGGVQHVQFRTGGSMRGPRRRTRRRNVEDIGRDPEAMDHSDGDEDWFCPCPHCQ